MEGWVLEVVVICCDEDGERDQEESNAQSIHARPLIGKGGIAREAGCVNHRQLIHQLHRILQARVESEAPDPHRHVPGICDEEDGIVIVLVAVPETLEGKPDEEQVRQRVDDFGGVYGGIVVLLGISKQGLDSFQQNWPLRTSSE